MDEQRTPTPVAVALAFVLSAIGCLAFAWAVGPDLPDVSSMLARTAVAVGSATVLTLGCLGVGRSWRRHRDRRLRFLALATPALIVLAVTAVLALNRGDTGAAFMGVARAETGEWASATAARWAWWCACLAVLAAVAATLWAYFPPDERPPERRPDELPQPWLAIGAAATVAVVVAVGVVGTAGRTPDTPAVVVDTASRVEAPPTPPLTGAVAYRIDVVDDSNVFVAAGAGFARWRSGGSSYDSADILEGFDGATGQKRWSLQVDGVRFAGLGATGVGPDSVVIGRSYDGVLAVDATTGELLWRRDSVGVVDPERPERWLAPGLLLTTQRVPEPPGLTAAAYGDRWEAVAPRTGEVLWDRTFRYSCYPWGYATGDALLVGSCETPGDVFVEVLDPSTGQRRGTVPFAALGVDPAMSERRDVDVTVVAAQGKTALVEVTRYRPERTQQVLLVDVDSGSVVRRLPEQHDAAYLDADTLVLTGIRGHKEPRPMSLLDVRTGRTTPLPMWSARVAAEGRFGDVARVGSDIVTVAPPDEAAARTALDSRRIAALPFRVIDAAGATRALPGPCGQDARGPSALAVVPGAVVVQCSDQWVGIR